MERKLAFESAFSSSSDPARTAVYGAAPGPSDPREAASGFAALFRYVEDVTGLSTLEIRDFFAMGMLMNVAAAMDLPQICGEDDSWARELRDTS